MPRLWRPADTLRIAADGTWTTGDQPVRHPATARYLKRHLVFEEGGDYVSDGKSRVPVEVDGPAFQVVGIELDEASGDVWLLLDDDSREALAADALSMNPDNGRFECLVRDGKGRALLSRSAHETLLHAADEAGGDFFLACGDKRYRIRV